MNGPGLSNCLFCRAVNGSGLSNCLFCRAVNGPGCQIVYPVEGKDDECDFVWLMDCEYKVIIMFSDIHGSKI